MAFQVNGGGVIRRGRLRSTGTLSEINIIPLVDVVLVLLIIFMLTAHVMEFGLEVEVPKVKQERNSAQDLPVVTMTSKGDILLGDKPLNINALGDDIRRRYPNAKAVYLRADRNTIWDPLAQLISALGTAKFDVRVVTQPQDDAGKRR